MRRRHRARATSTSRPSPDFTFPLDALLAAISPATPLIYLTDPNNPTGLAIPAGARRSDRHRRARDARASSTRPTPSSAAARSSVRRSNATATSIVGRTFAKAHGLAALRVGALVAHPDTLAPLRRRMPPFSVNIVRRARAAARAGRSRVPRLVRRRRRPSRASSIYDVRAGSAASATGRARRNFVLHARRRSDASRSCAAWPARGILVRDQSTAPGCAGCIRITAGIVDHTRACLAALEDVLASRTN